MTSFKTVGDTKLSTLLRGVSRFGMFCGVLAMVALTSGCPLTDPCNGFEVDDTFACTVDTCALNDAGEPEAIHTPVDCGDTQICNPADGECVDCLSDADCTQGFCSEAGGNVCVECVTDPNCDDGNSCTTDTCTDATCGYADVADGAACADDGNVCTDNACSGGVCEPTDVADATACDDGILCTLGDACTAGVCGGTPILNCCVSLADCIADAEICNPVTNRCEPIEPDCTVANDCNDDNDCTTDTCVDGACDNTNNTSACNDANACTTGDVCAAGVCAGTAVVCPSGQSCNSATGNCAAATCTAAANCNDNASCTADTCNLGTGLCVFTPIDTTCNDNLHCNGTEGAGSCDPDDPDAEAGTGCVRPGNPCEVTPLTPVCNEATNGCQACTTNAECNDGFSCTSDTCTIATGACSNFTSNDLCPDPLKCDGNDVCDPENDDADPTTGCYAPGNPCEPKVCNESTYVVGNAATCSNCTGNADCNDGIICTQDSCDGGTGNCTNTPNNTLCPDSLFCNGDDVCSPDDPDADNATGCTNGLEVAYPCATACNETTNACFACTSNLECSDGIACTDDVCNGVTGLCTHTDNCDGCVAGGGCCNRQNGQCDVD